MKKKVLAAIMAAVMLSVTVTGCQSSTTQVSKEETQEAVAEEAGNTDEEESRAETVQEESTETDEDGANLATGGGSPWIDSNLKNNITDGMEISIKDDFHLAVNYDWLLNNEKEFLVMEPAYLERLNELYTEENLEDIKNYMLVTYVMNMAGMLSSNNSLLLSAAYS